MKEINTVSVDAIVAVNAIKLKHNPFQKLPALLQNKRSSTFMFVKSLNR